MFFLVGGYIFMVLAVLAITLGIGTAINCARGLFSGEGMYDRENARYMVWMQIAGVLGGICAVVWGINTLFGGLLH
jgi:hypothetical protein